MFKRNVTNTFRFKGFHERIGAIKIDVIHKIQKSTETPEDEDTFFYEALAKWTELNCTLHFQDFASKVKPYVQSFAQLVYHEEQVIALLKEHLQIRESLAVEPLLDLVVQLSKDLQADFYPHFSNFFRIFLSLLKFYWRDTEILECTFTTMCYLFKFLWRFMVKDIDNVFRLYSPLLVGEQKYYIQQFAAESFSFLMRKMKDSSKLFDVIFSALTDEPSLCQGLGFLCFEMIKGIKKQFHSLADSVLPVLFSKLGAFQRKADHVLQRLPWKMVFQSLVHMTQSMAKHTSKENCEVVEKTFLQELKRLVHVHNEQQLNSDQEAALKDQISLLLELADVWVSWRSGSLISAPMELFYVVKMMMTCEAYTVDPVGVPLLKLSSSLLLSSFTELSGQCFNKEVISTIFNKVHELPKVFTFCRNLLHWENFRSEVFPFLLTCCQDELLKDSCNLKDVFFMLTEVVVNSSATDSCGLDLETQKGLLFSPKCGTKHGGKILQAFLGNLVATDDHLLDSNWLSLMWGCLVCIPCISPLDAHQCSSQLLSFISCVSDYLFSQKVLPNEQKVLCVVCQAIKTYTLVTPSGGALSIQLDFSFMLKLIRSWPDNVHVLQACNKLIVAAKQHGIKTLLCVENLQEISVCLQLNLSSASHLVRLLSLRILASLDHEESATELKVPCLSNSAIFELCLSAEEIPLHLDTYRDKIARLQKLRFSSLYSTLSDFAPEVALRYLIGLLRVNFSPLWEPVIDIITSFTSSSNRQQFWKVFTELLVLAVEGSEKTLNEEVTKERLSTRTDGLSEKSIGCLNDLFDMHLNTVMGPRQDNRADDVNFRYLMWKAMASFPEIAEQRSRDVVPLFLRFVSNEYFVAMENVAPSQDITAQQFNQSTDGMPADPSQSEDIEVKTSALSNQSETTEFDSNQSESDQVKTPTFSQSETKVLEINDRRSEPRDTVFKKRHKTATKSLCIHLSLFTVFKNPKALYNEYELRQLFLTFLAHREGEVQNLALQCLFTYKFDYLEPYKENLQRLLGDDKCRDELAHFTIDEENSVVDGSHRQKLMPVLIRLLYGKMQRSTGAGTTGKTGIGVRRSVVLRFLASCPEEELGIFIDLILAPFKHLLTGDNGSTDLSNIVPLKKQLGFLGMASDIFKKMANHAVSFFPSILQIILSILSTCAFALEHRDTVYAPFIPQLKTVRQQAISRLTEFFEFLTDYDFRPICDAVFSSAVWPQVEKLHQESIQHPTPLLKLLFAWSKNPRYFPLLSRRPAVKSDLSIMSHVFACLRAPSVSADVVAMIMEMTDNLLIVGDSEVQQEVSDLMDAGSELRDEANYDCKNRPSYGSLLVLPHISAILEHLSHSVKTAIGSSGTKGKAKRKVILPQRELSVLSKISSFVKDSQQSSMLIGVLVPVLRSSLKEETINNILNTIRNLLSNVGSPKEFAVVFSRLFSQIIARRSRQYLCEIFSELSSLDASFSVKTSEILSQLNAWDARRVDEPDYDARLAGFSSAKLLIQQGELQTEEVLPILHNCIHFVLCSDDLSIRDSAGSCLSSIVRFVMQQIEKTDHGFHLLIMNCLLPACKRALSSKNEPARNEFLSVLSTMVVQFDHEAFSDMKVLLDSDPEKDFFENIKHIQLHRRIRALRRLQSHCQQHSLRTTTLTTIMLPLATHCVFSHTAAKEHNLVTEAITTIGTISASLPWSKYCALLKQYLKLLPVEKNHQKVIVRIVVAILNSFHFDLSAVPMGVENDESKNAVIVTMLNEQGAQQFKEKSNNRSRTDVKVKAKGDGDTELDRDNDSDNGGEDDEEGEGISKEEMKDVCKDDLALRIYSTIKTTILPQLHKCITKKTKSADFHRLSHQKAEDEEDVLRIPIILAMIKLLQALPQHTLHLHLPGLLLRVCQALKSRAREVRDAARDTLAKITVSIGTQYFSFVLKELRSSLTRGYQLHVLSFTLHTLLEKMIDNLSPGHLDHCLEGITEVLVEDLFGEVAAEREVEKIANKLPEAKTCKSFDTFEILGKYVGSQSLTVIVFPLKQVLDSGHNHKTARRVEEVLRRVGVGLQSNASLTPQTLLIFIHGLTNENVPLLKPDAAEKKVIPRQPDPRLQPGSTFLLPPTPSRGGNVPETSTQTNHHILVEFGLQMLYMMLKHGKVSASERELQEMLDPFVKQLTDCLKSKYTKAVTISLRCLSWLVKFPLPSLTNWVPTIGKLLFKILRNYAKAGAKVGDNFEMVLSAFKAMTVIIRDFKQYTVAEKHLQVLLGLVEEDIHDHSRQGTAFPLLKAILSRKLVVPEIHDVMRKVGQLSITGPSPSVQLQCRQCMLQFLLDYPLGNKLQRYLEFYVSQLSYEHDTGRESTLEMLASIFSSFPEKLLFECAGFFFVPLASRLVNDDSASCRKLTALTMKTLLEKLDADRRHKLFSIVLLWFKDEKISVRRLAAQVGGLFVEVEGKNFERRLTTVLPIVADVIAPDYSATQENQLDEDEQENFKVFHRIKDHLLFHTITFLAKVIKECKIIRNPSRQEDLAGIWESVEAHLLHPHAWVRLASSRLFGLLFSAWKPEELVTGYQAKKRVYLQEDLPDKVATLCDIFSTQLRSPLLDKELGEQIVKNLLFLAKLLRILGREADSEHDIARDQGSVDDNGPDKPAILGGKRITLKALMRNMNKLATQEASQTPKKTLQRCCVLRWLAAVSLDLGNDEIQSYLVDILSPVYRELDMAATYKDPELKKLSQEVLELIKGIVDREAFSCAYSSLQQAATESRETRKRKKALEAVADPAKSARNKLKRNLAKKETRKRKIDALKPERKLKAPRMKND